ncbi:Signal recognition particle subunit SRP72 [Galdieria sulphuraria]|uniref:Signal recognition particle subunit SRP72 n=1 Tax=Galdieria sulphuraria TaxID=130081 RepID=M2X8C4_GALSU|nr:signal recognition particle subunit SRP72 [Galdieria sulphuraria]EME26097.1 signal recognition particle subunit SRP72 [Galdieria sulphuraria]GJD12877.1 Signal recognition particle subunit SRP72 [Galdieria sulphuraria]|eukprot:XP_005702617.1 signal recognition particle subunit SRP72 [Galdieria sulphuraria]
MNQQETISWQLFELQSQHENGEYSILLQKSHRILQTLSSLDTSDAANVIAKKQLLSALQARCFALLRLGRTKEALQGIDKLLSYPLDSIFSKEKKAEILYYKAYALYNAYQLEEALETCQKIKELDPQRGALHLEAQILFRCARYKEASQLFCQFLSFNPTIENICNAASAQLLSGNWREALNICQKQPGSYELMFIEACAYCESESVEKAEQCLLEAIQQCSSALQEDQRSQEEIEEELLPLKTQLAFVYQLSGREAKAEELLHDIVTKKGNDWNSYSVAVCNLVALRGYREVHDSLKRLKSIITKKSFVKLTHKQQVAILLNRILLLLHLRKFDACILGLNELVKREEWELVLLLKCCILDRQRKWDEASQFVRDFAISHSDLSLQCDAILAQMALNKGDLKMCIDVLKHSKNLSHYPGVISTVACLYEMLGETETAVEIMRELVQKPGATAEESKKLMMSIGYLLRRKHLYDRAKELLDDHLFNYPNDIEVVAENVVATCHVDLSAAVTWAEKLPSLALDSPSLTEETESKFLGLILRSYHSSNGEQDAKDHDRNKNLRKKRRRGKKPLPKGYNPNQPPPDPEKWLPRSARNLQKKKKKSSKHHEIPKMQGADVSKVDNSMDWQRNASSQVNDSLSDRPKGSSRRKAPRKRR